LKKPKRVSWVDWDRWELECTCGEVITMTRPLLKVKCPKCGAEWVMTNYVFWGGKVVGFPTAKRVNRR